MAQHLFGLLAAAALVRASPFPQGVTMAVAPEASVPAACSTDRAERFGIAVMSAMAGPVVSQIGDGQPQAPTSTAASIISQISDGQIQGPTSAAPIVSQISDGQVQAATSAVAGGTIVSQISDGQIQAATSAPAPSMTMIGVSQIADGQIQGPACTPSAQVADGQMGCMRVPEVTQISDGQIQAPLSTATVQSTITNTVTAVTQINDGQIQAATATPVSQINDGQIQATGVATGASATAVNENANGQIQGAGSANFGRVACQENATLGLLLDGGRLTDDQNRTGYIASNRQLQFDDPPQAGAIYTHGFSVCSNGSLALGGSTTFYQCRSGGFYNLYDQNIASYCEPVTLNSVDLISCSSD